jgi:broad specificity phosphatase PhoE
LHDAVLQRMTASLLRIAHAERPVQETALVVSHGGSIRVALSAVTATLIPALPNGALFRVTIVDQRFVDVTAL